MALPETNQKPSVQAPKQSVNSNVPEHDENHTVQTPAPVAALSQIKDPRQLGADLADKYLHIGSQLGFALFLVWGVISLATLPAVIIGVGLIPGAIFNMLLFSPKAVYKLSEFILDLFGFGEALQAADAAGIGKIKITIADWQKGLIIFYDIIAAIVILIFIFTVFMATCTIANSTAGKIAGKASDIINNSNTYASISGLCTNVTK